MKILKITSTALMALILISCKKETVKTEKNTDSLVVKKDSVIVPEIHKELYGIYTGDFFTAYEN